MAIIILLRQIKENEPPIPHPSLGFTNVAESWNARFEMSLSTGTMQCPLTQAQLLEHTRPNGFNIEFNW